MTPTQHGAALEVRQLSFRYAGAPSDSLHDLSFSAAPGEMIAIMGASGAGKTTLAKCLARVIPSFTPGDLSGELLLDGMPLTRHSVADLAGHVALVSQDFEAQLFSSNIAQEIAFGLEQAGLPPTEIGDRIAEALDAVGLHGFERRDPATLSGGEKQRLAIASMLALRPRLLILDEPTTDLDPAGKAEVLAALAAMRQRGMTLLVIEHEFAAATLADRTLLLAHGTIHACATAGELERNPDLLETNGVRPPDLAVVAARHALASVPHTVDEAATALAGRLSSPAATAAPAAMASGEALLRLVDATYRYDARTVLDGISLTIHAGEFLALLGRNGVGKTTLAKQMNGLLQPASGTVLLGDQPVAGRPAREIAAHVGYVFQNPDSQIFATTVYEEVAFAPRNLGLAPGEVEERVRDALAALHLQDAAQVDPFLLNRGDRQRLALASVLAQRPRVLILDEPTTGLDYLEQRRMAELLVRLRRDGVAVVVITHSPWLVAECASRCFVLAAGRCVFDGSFREMLGREEVLRDAHFVPPEIDRLAIALGTSAESLRAKPGQP